ncbi:hypothetical protein TRM7615_02076 [Falsiruegeria mediterranea M17]|uniref:Uncharacterized protein n=1 Tax=Falsiruegeria mediterranea M17 TaxID=1200281 RepID=A0A2R8C818_9RHOB|nr:hypothetical protein [Falsiruegeria mediterranea]SPJ28574.1 hypothetical protein TRM7615_02076 [Falsiruegeria mediterranea M17]
MSDTEGAIDDTSSASLAHSHFSVSSLPRRHRFEEWRESISCVFEVEASSDVRQDNFKASVDGHLLDGVMLAQTSSRQQTWHRSSQRIAADGMDHYMVQLFSSGNMATDQGPTGGVAPKDGLVVFDLSRKAKSAANNFINVSLILPREMVAPFLQAPDDQHLRYLSSEEPLVRLLHNQIATLRSIAPDMTTAQAIEVVPHAGGLLRVSWPIRPWPIARFMMWPCRAGSKMPLPLRARFGQILTNPRANTAKTPRPCAVSI